MPLYEYHCKKCNVTISEFRRIIDRDNIPKCEKPNCEMFRPIFAAKLNFVGEDWPSVQVNMRKQYESEKFIDSITK